MTKELHAQYRFKTHKGTWSQWFDGTPSETMREKRVVETRMTHKKQWENTPARQAAQKKFQELGSTIRDLLCLDSIAKRRLEPHRADFVRKMVDERLNQMGYESLTSRENRFRASMSGEFPPDSFYKLQKLPINEANR